MTHPLDALVGHWNTTGQSVPDDDGKAISIKGTDRDDLTAIPMNSFDSSGQHAVMQAKHEKPNEWVFSSDDLRARLVIAGDGRSMAARGSEEPMGAAGNTG